MRVIVVGATGTIGSVVCRGPRHASPGGLGGTSERNVSGKPLNVVSPPWVTETLSRLRMDPSLGTFDSLWRRIDQEMAHAH